MTTSSNSAHAVHAAAHAADAAHASSHGGMRSHLIGYGLSVVLTLASFGAVMGRVLPPGYGLAILVMLCLAQLLVQLVFFLHLGPRKGQRGHTAIFPCTVFLIAICVTGLLWVMPHAHPDLMPTH